MITSSILYSSLKKMTKKAGPIPQNGIFLLKQYDKANGTDMTSVISGRQAYDNFYSQAKKSHLHEITYLLLSTLDTGTSTTNKNNHFRAAFLICS